MSNFDAPTIITLVVVLIISVVGHEIAHGFVAFKFKDNTAKNAGRLSINPLKHIDILGTIVVPSLMYLAGGVLFGWAKPVPINTYTVIKNGGYFGAICVSLAGIVYNFLLALASFLLIYFGIAPEFGLRAISMLLTINLILGIFNLYPIPPLDGSHALSYVLRIFKFEKLANLYQSLSRYGFIILVILIISPVASYVFSPIYTILDLVKTMLISR
ncbi:site-2 protease family protein [Campylobacter fetus]|uniref:site-2 protease family protein n=1 Tax=Campylobacter fetus TaxID=196 RepID=UPI0005091D4A|nr:site-2 protease family protein [Campylobacter fetus]WKW16864.1 site-2 protease family protein [Campylobacter fetus subsp. fetus]HDX6329256.1 site-2 protease family protein [Campylobacter fetus subsp. venerealis]AIR79090.1 membrane-associated zinc metalloprotease, S2P/M50 family [Campylobacter fetus subsp. fetus 04/554]EAJ5692682.1 site-2 protease family protein [Campylobacter fetus]EAJ5704161.1 site-2 protease family protein [Campylobacter fetus]